MIHKIIGQLELQQKAGEIMFQVSEFSNTKSSPNQILVTSQTTHSEIRGLPLLCTPWQKKVVTTLYLILDTGKITIGIYKALEILQWPKLRRKKAKTEISMFLCIEFE